MSKKREPIITLQMPMSALLMAEVLEGVAYVYPHASVEVEPVGGRRVEIHAMPYSVHLVDKQGRRRFVCRCATMMDCAEEADKLLREAPPGMLVECLLETPNGAQPVAI